MAETTTQSTPPQQVSQPPPEDPTLIVARKIKSFGKGTLHSSETMSRWTLFVVSIKMIRRLANAMGGWGTLIKIFSRSNTIGKERKATCVAELKKLGITNEDHCNTLLMTPLMYAAAIDVLGSEEKAHQAFLTAIAGAKAEDTGLDMTEVARLLPIGYTPDFALKVYSHLMKSMNEVDSTEGVRKGVDIEDTPNVCGFDVTFCAYAEAFRLAGVPHGCSVICAGDEAFIPPVIEPLGLHFERTGTIGNGQQRCDFRFVIGPKPQKQPQPQQQQQQQQQPPSTTVNQPTTVVEVPSEQTQTTITEQQQNQNSSITEVKQAHN